MPHLTDCPSRQMFSALILSRIDFASDANLYSIWTAIWHYSWVSFFLSLILCEWLTVIKKSVFHNTITVQMENIILSAPNNSHLLCFKSWPDLSARDPTSGQLLWGIVLKRPYLIASYSYILYLFGSFLGFQLKPDIWHNQPMIWTTVNTGEGFTVPSFKLLLIKCVPLHQVCTCDQSDLKLGTVVVLDTVTAY